MTYLGILLVWPGWHQAERFVFALMPVLMILLATGVDLTLGSRQRARWALTALIVIMSIAGVVDLGRRALWAYPQELVGYRRLLHWQEAASAPAAIELVARVHAIRNTLQAARDYVPEDGCIYTQYPEWVAVYSNRFGVEFPAPNRVDLLRDPSRRQCEFLFVTDATTIQHPYPDYYPASALSGALSPILTVSLPGEEGIRLTAALAEFR